MFESLWGGLITAFDLIVVIFIIVLFHEFGHYIFSIIFGVRVKEFAIGFGKKIFGKKKNNTDYNIRLIPLGGFVELAGTDPNLKEEEKDIPEGEKFYNKPAWQRFLILIAGPVFNFILAFLVFIILFVFIGLPDSEYVDGPVIGAVLKDRPAYKAGLTAGDKIVSIDGNAIKTWEDMAKIIKKNPDKALNVFILRDDETKNIIVRPEKSGDGLGIIGVIRGIKPIIGEVMPGMPAYKAGLKPGDVILSVNGIRIYCWEKVREIINKNVDKKIKIKIKRNNKEMTFEVVPFYSPEVESGVIGMRYKTVFVKGENIGDSIKFAIDNTYRTIVFMIRGIKKLIFGRISLKNVTGPVGIASIVKQNVETGWGGFLNIIALLSINIGLLNLLPFPALDGGRLIFIFWEMITGFKVPISIEEKVHQVGLYFLLFLMGIVTYRDIVNLLFK